MTIIEAINSIDALKPNTYTQTEKIKWLSALDGMIKKNVIDTHEPEKVLVIVDEGTEDEREELVDKEIIFDGYDDDTPLDTELIVGSPYEELYVAWLEAKIDYANSEYVKYNNSITHYNDIYKSFYNDYNRTNMPKGSAIRYW